MKITLAKTAGFCFGVGRAVNMVEQAVSEGKNVATLGPIIHNRHVTDRFARQGVRELNVPGQAAPGSCVIIRSHGVSRAVQEELEALDIEIVDATCPFVKRIHKLVAEAEKAGRLPIIIGVPDHPEVKAIAGWCSHSKVFETPEQLQNWLEEAEENRKMPVTLVCQTTSTQKLWENCKEIIKKECTNHEIFDTICEATEKRQKEAGELAGNSDAMVVVGDPNSSNTKRLAMICRQYCSNVVLIEDADGLDLSHLSCANSVGITAGASTPAWIIKEVNNKMSEEIRVETAAEEDFAELLEQSIKTLNNGDKVTGVVTAIGATEIQVDLGTKHAGYILIDDFSSDPAVKVEEVLKVGDEIEVAVVHVNDSEGTVRLSKKRLEAGKTWEEVEAAVESKAVVEGVITEENKGGVVANVKGLRVFIPASQTGVPKGGDLAALVKTTVQMRITEVNRARRRVVGSISAITRELRKAAQEQIWSEIEVGKKYNGTVKSLTSYGAFVDIGGVDGMVHVSELSWNRIKNPSEVVKVGDEIEVFVISFDAEKKKISLGYKTADSNPWTIFNEKYQVGDVATVKIVKLMTFGAFAEIIPGVDGLIHISQIADRRIGKPEDVLAEGQEVEAKIIDVDAENKRISLSIRALLVSDEEAVEEAAEETAEAVEEAVEKAAETVEEAVEEVVEEAAEETAAEE